MFLFIIIFYLLYYILYLLFSIFVYILLINSMVLKKQYNYSAVLGKNTSVFSRMYLIKYFKYQGHVATLNVKITLNDIKSNFDIKG